jgi:branched-subunit amino acid transport protein
LGQWVRFFLGTPQRFLRTLIGVAIMTAFVKPEILVNAVNGLYLAVQPLIAPAITIAIVVYAIKIIVSRGK